MTTLEPAWTRGPYEKQEITVGTPYQPLPVTLPNMMNHVHGARKACCRTAALAHIIRVCIYAWMIETEADSSTE
jgi:hypothetical protein